MYDSFVAYVYEKGGYLHYNIEGVVAATGLSRSELITK